MGVRKKDFHPTTPGSLWVPMSEQTGRKGKSSKPSSWEHRVTKETVRTKPKECRGAILADDVSPGPVLPWYPCSYPARRLTPITF